MSSWVRILSVVPIVEASLAAVIEWQRQGSIEPTADGGWVELGCRFNESDSGLEPEFIVLAPPSPVCVGDRLDVEATAALDLIMPPGPSEGPPVPRAVATTIAPHADGWQAHSAPAAAGNVLFALDPDGLAVIDVFRGLIPGVGVLLWGDAQSGVLGAMSSAFGLASRATIPVTRTVDFALWLPRGIPAEVSHANRAGRPIECSWTEARTLIMRDGSGVEIVAPFEDPPEIDLSRLPPADYFAARADGAEAIRIEKPTGLPFDALNVITSQRPSGTVTFCVDGQDRLVIGTADPSVEGLTVDGPGFATHLGHRNVVVSVPYFAALALQRGVARHAVSAWVDDVWGIVDREGMMAQIVWSTATGDSA
jgi:hypothetical protein